KESPRNPENLQNRPWLSVSRLHRGKTQILGKGPLMPPPGAKQINNQAADENDRGIADLAGEVGSRKQDKNKSKARQQRWQGIEPHAKWAWHFRTPNAEDDQPDCLNKKLQQDANDNQCGNDIEQRKKAAQDRDATQCEKRDVGKTQPGMDAGESAAIISIQSGGIGNAGVAKYERKHRSEGRPNHKDRHQVRCPCSVNSLHEGRNNVELAALA